MLLKLMKSCVIMGSRHIDRRIKNASRKLFREYVPIFLFLFY